MTTQFNRNIELIIGNEQSANTPNALKISKSPKSNANLRISANIIKLKTGYPTRAVIKVYNLNSQNRAKIEEKFSKLILNAGYGENVKLVFLGEIYYVYHITNGKDIVTTIYCQSNKAQILQRFFNRTYNANTSNVKVLQDVVNNMEDVTIGEIDEPEIKNVGSFSTTFSDTNKTILDNITASLGLEWALNDGIITFKKLQVRINDGELIPINANNGMIESPTISENGRISVTTLLKPSLQVFNRIDVQSVSPTPAIVNYGYQNLPNRDLSRIITGRYFVEKIEHNIDNYGEFTTTIQAYSTRIFETNT